MTLREIRKRFRLIALGYLILLAAAVAGIYVNYHQSQQIRHQAEQICHHVALDRQLAIDCAHIFK